MCLHEERRAQWQRAHSQTAKHQNPCQTQQKISSRDLRNALARLRQWSNKPETSRMAFALHPGWRQSDPTILTHDALNFLENSKGCAREAYQGSSSLVSPVRQRIWCFLSEHEHTVTKKKIKSPNVIYIFFLNRHRSSV